MTVHYTRAYGSTDFSDLVYYVYAQTEGGTPVITYYDRDHRPLLTESQGFDGRAIYQRAIHDQKGRLTKTSKPYFGANPGAVQYTTYDYDNFDRKTKIISPDGSVTTLAYNGLTTTATNHRGQSHTESIDGQGRVTEAIDQEGNKISYFYTADGLPTRVETSYSDPGSPPTAIDTIYNDLRQKEAVTDPNTGTSYTFYDGFGRVIEIQHRAMDSTLPPDKQPAPRRLTEFRDYDLLDRPGTRITYKPSGDKPNGDVETTTRWRYDDAPGYGLGKVHTVTLTGGADVSASNPIKDVTAYGENAAFSNGKGEVVDTFAYDALGRVISSKKELKDYLSGSSADQHVPWTLNEFIASSTFEPVSPAAGLYGRHWTPPMPME